MDEANLKKKLLAGDKAAGISPIDINHDTSITPLNPYQYSEYKY